MFALREAVFLTSCLLVVFAHPIINKLPTHKSGVLFGLPHPVDGFWPNRYDGERCYGFKIRNTAVASKHFPFLAF
jgi:hypothetical protein